MTGTAAKCGLSSEHDRYSRARLDPLAPIAVCAIFRDEAPFLLEWIAYHTLIGVDHFVLYDNSSTDGGAALIRGSRFAGRVTLIDWAEDPGQITAYRDFRIRHASRFDWVAFIDLDEFILPLATDSLPEVLNDPLYAGFSAVQMNWLVFGPSGHNRRPSGLAIENYTRRVDDPHQMNGHVKSIVRCRDLFEIFDTPHIFYTTATQCNTAGKLANLQAITETPCFDAMVVNHYFTRSRQDWRMKLRRGRADTDDPKRHYRMAMFDTLAHDAMVEDRRIVRFVPDVKKLLG
ncbi:MAG TPA: glycosyltransferase family 92 protein [Acetobacteraceae bacterium]